MIWSQTLGTAAHPAIVLIHGSMDRSEGLSRLARILAAKFCVICYDRRGYGRSMAVGPPFGVADNVDDLACLVDVRTGGAGVALAFGHSFGGNVALSFAESYPSLVRRVCVYEPPLAWLDWWPTATAGGVALAQQDAASAAEVFLRRLVGDHRWERWPVSIRSSRRAEGPALVGELADLRAGPPWTGSCIARPVLAMHGERAGLHHRQAMETLSRWIPRAQVATVPGAGHLGPSTHADAVCVAIDRFIAAT